MSRAKGSIAEKQAVDFLCKNDFTIIETNFYSRFGEIDIIATKDGVLHFIEVKSAPSFDVAVANITPAKLSKVIKTAEVFMKKNVLDIEHTFDAVIVTPSSLEFIEDITL